MLRWTLGVVSLCAFALAASFAGAVPVTNSNEGAPAPLVTPTLQGPAEDELARVRADDEESENDLAIDTNFAQTGARGDGGADEQVVRTEHLASPSPVPDHLVREIRMPKRIAKSDDGRGDMAAGENVPLDADCDSPQLGETEPWPIGPTEVNMNANNRSSMESHSMGSMHEQDDATREVLPVDSGKANPPAADHSSANLGHSEANAANPIEFDPDFRSETLPLPNPEENKKIKCSRFLNGHDVPDALHMLDDECGMPEPVIPCETPGNSTLCVKRLQLDAPPIPKAELMPPVPPSVAPGASFSDQYTNISVEFVDFGVTKTVETDRKSVV